MLSNLFIDDVYKLFCRNTFRCELDHELSAADSNVFLVECIEGLLTFLADVDQTSIAEDSQVVRDGGLGEPNLLNDLIDGQPATAALAHNLLAGLVGNCFGK